MSFYIAVKYKLHDRTHTTKSRDICPRVCGVMNFNWQVIRLRKKSEKSICPLLLSSGCCDDAEQLIRWSEIIGSFVLYMSIKVIPDLTSYQRRVRKHYAIGLHDSITANDQLETIYNTIKGLKLMNNEHDVTPQTVDHSVYLDESADQKRLGKIRIKTVTKKNNDISNPDCSRSKVLKCYSCDDTSNLTYSSEN